MNTRAIEYFSKKVFLPLFFSAFFVSFLFAASPELKIVIDGNRCVDLVFQEKFTDAHLIANNIIKQYSDSPAGYFLRAAVYHYQMIYLRKNIYEKQLYEACAKGVQIGEQSRGKDEWNDFFLAATIGVQGNFDRVNGRLVSSLKLAWRSMEIFKTMDEEAVIDILYGTGIYDYWVGANAKLLWWMPNVKDNRPQALQNLATIQKKGVFTKLIVNYDLMEMYINEKKYSQAIDIANGILKKYPTNTIALWALFEAYDSMKDKTGRDDVALKIFEKNQTEKDNIEQLKYYEKKTRRNS
jgi:tetratricopeptide (TPR) repeat protein